MSAASKSELARYLDAVTEDPTVMNELPDEVVHDPSFVARAVRRNLAAMFFAPAALADDRDFVKRLVRENGSVIQVCSQRMREDPEIILAALPTFPAAVEDAIELRRSEKFMLEAIRRHRNALTFAAQALLEDDGFIEAAARIDPLCLALAPGPTAQRVMSKNPALGRAFSKVSGELESLDIEFPCRFGRHDVLREIIHNRSSRDPRDQRPIAVAIFPKRDDKGAFELNSLAELMRAYRLMYFEVAEDTDVARVMAEACAKRKAELVIIAGHGVRDQLALGADDPADHDAREERFVLDTRDGSKLTKENFGTYVAPGAMIVLKSCSTGEGRRRAENLANFVWSRAPHATVFAPEIPTNNVLELDGRGRVKAPGYLCGPERTYRIAARPKLRPHHRTQREPPSVSSA